MKVQVEFQYDGHRVMMPVDIADEEAGRAGELIAGAIAYYTPQGFTVPAATQNMQGQVVQTMAPTLTQRLTGAPPQQQQQFQGQPQQQGQPQPCPHHGMEKGKWYNGRWECAVTTQSRPTYAFEDKGQGYTFLGKVDGIPRFVCAHKG